MAAPAIVVEGLRKEFRIGQRERYGALRDVIAGDRWYLGTDLGVITSSDQGATWNRVTGFPYVTVLQLKLGPDGAVYAATYGRSLWRVTP